MKKQDSKKYHINIPTERTTIQNSEHLSTAKSAARHNQNATAKKPELINHETLMFSELESQFENVKATPKDEL